MASTGREAIETLGGNGRSVAELPPRLVLLDFHLPDISGLDVLRWIRADSSLRALPVVMLSVASDERMVADCLEAGANAFVAKSACHREFRDAVTRIADFWMSDCRLPRSCGRPSEQVLTGGA